VLSQIVHQRISIPFLSVSVWQHSVKLGAPGWTWHFIGPLVNLGFANTSNLEVELRINAIAKNDMSTIVIALPLDISLPYSLI
jgi:hypothetical protein